MVSEECCSLVILFIVSCCGSADLCLAVYYLVLTHCLLICVSVWHGLLVVSKLVHFILHLYFCRTSHVVDFLWLTVIFCGFLDVHFTVRCSVSLSLWRNSYSDKQMWRCTGKIVIAFALQMHLHHFTKYPKLVLPYFILSLPYSYPLVNACFWPMLYFCWCIVSALVRSTCGN